MVDCDMRPEITSEACTCRGTNAVPFFRLTDMRSAVLVADKRRSLEGRAQPTNWLKLSETQGFIKAVEELAENKDESSLVQMDKRTKCSENKTGMSRFVVIKGKSAKDPMNSGTWAHWRIALAYAESNNYQRRFKARSGPLFDKKARS